MNTFNNNQSIMNNMRHVGYDNSINLSNISLLLSDDNINYLSAKITNLLVNVHPQKKRIKSS